MIEEMNTLRLPTKNAKDIEITVNWNDNPEVKGCKLLKMKVEGKDYIVDRDQLVNLLMVLGSEQNLKDLMPVTLTQVKRYETILEFQWKASRNFQKGETITVQAPHIVSLPITDERFAGALKKKERGLFDKFKKNN